MAGVMRPFGSVEIAAVLAGFAGGRKIAVSDCVAAVIEVYRVAGLIDCNAEIISRQAAVQLLRQVASNLGDGAAHVLAGLGWLEISPDNAGDLDCGVCRLWGQQTMAIAHSGKWLAPGPDGVVMASTALRAWRAPVGGGYGN